MDKNIQRRDLLKRALFAVPGALALSSCGTLIYPERRGRTSGRIDPDVVIMDGLLCLVFILPGVIAFAVDFSTGAIYTGGYAKLDKHEVPGGTEADYNQALAKATGQQLKLSDAALQVHDQRGRLSVDKLEFAKNATDLKKATLVKDDKGRITRALIA